MELIIRRSNAPYLNILTCMHEKPKTHEKDGGRRSNVLSISYQLAKLGAEAAAPEPSASAAGEAFVSADEGAVVATHARTLELMALRLANPRLCWLHPPFCMHAHTQSSYTITYIYT
ncbi:hypothetical protein V6N11_036197 [Hibiscus sabdariffa]|uniref:Uncharacterized protein n=1 Tax=Hibiscus sabdariffa TaxID=183260 RepID=A0ABR2RAD2_9ROSI